MIMIKIAIVEDEIVEQERLKKYLEQYQNEVGVKFTIDVFDRTFFFVEKYKADYQIIFLDIELPDGNGMDIANKIRLKDHDVVIVFITNLGQYAIKGYEVQAYDFILKPVKYERFKTLLNRLLHTIKIKKDSFLVLKTTSGLTRISSLEIQYVSVDDHLLYYYTADKTYECWETLKAAEAKLPKPMFARLNKSTLVNLRFVQAVNNDSVTLVNGTILPFSHLQKQQILIQLNQLL